MQTAHVTTNRIPALHFTTFEKVTLAVALTLLVASQVFPNLSSSFGWIKECGPLSMVSGTGLAGATLIRAHENYSARIRTTVTPKSRVVEFGDTVARSEELLSPENFSLSLDESDLNMSAQLKKEFTDSKQHFDELLEKESTPGNQTQLKVYAKQIFDLARRTFELMDKLANKQALIENLERNLFEKPKDSEVDERGYHSA